MSPRQTYIDYANTPASEQEVYFDAPVASWGKDDSDDAPPATTGERTKTLPGAFEPEQPLEDTRAPTTLTHKPSLTIGAPRDPIVRKGPADGAEDEEPLSPAQDSISGDKPRSKVSQHRRSMSVADSGYGSTSPSSKLQRSASRASTNIAPLPVVWSKSPSSDALQRGQAMHHSLDDNAHGDEDADGARPSARRNDTGFQRASSLRSFRSAAPTEGGRASVRTTPSVLRRRRVSLSGGSFAAGAGTVGPAASQEMDEEFDARSRSAEAGLTEKQKAKLNKAQMKEGKKVAKVIKAEGKAEKKALDDAVKELADIQKLQKSAVKEEGKIYASYSKVLREFRKVELEYLAARAKYERAQAELNAFEDAREASKQHAQDATEMLQEKNKEVEWLRAQKAVDDRERLSKIKQLTGKA